MVDVMSSRSIASVRIRVRRPQLLTQLSVAAGARTSKCTVEIFRPSANVVPNRGGDVARDIREAELTSDRDRLAKAVEAAVELALRPRIREKVEALRDALTGRADAPQLTTEETDQKTDDVVRAALFRLKEHESSVLQSFIDAIADALVFEADGSLVASLPGSATAFRLRSRQAPPRRGVSPALSRAMKKLQGTTPGGSRTAPPWRYKGYMQYASEVDRTVCLFTDALGRRKDGSGLSDVLRKIAEDRRLRELAHADINDACGSAELLAMRHAARVTGTGVKTPAILRKYYERGSGLLEGDAIAGVIDEIEPMIVDVHQKD
jgi:hypothetical protein